MPRAGTRVHAAALALSWAVGVADTCAMFRNGTAYGFGRISNTTGSITSALSLPAVDEARDVWTTDADTAGVFYFASGTSLSSLSLRQKQHRTLPITAPSAYTGTFTVQSICASANASGAVAALVSAKWAAVVAIDGSTGTSTLLADISASYFAGNYTFLPGVCAWDTVDGIYWLVSRWSHGSDLGVGFSLGPARGVIGTSPSSSSSSAPLPAPTVVPFPEGNTVTSLAFGGPFFSGPGLVALVLEPVGSRRAAAASATSNGAGGAEEAAGATTAATAARTLTLLGSFLDEGGQPDFFEVANYNSSSVNAGAYQLALSRDSMLAFVGMKVKPGSESAAAAAAPTNPGAALDSASASAPAAAATDSVVSFVNTQTNNEVGRVRAEGYTVLGLVDC